MAPAKGRQRGIGDRDAMRDELFMDPDQIAAAAIDPVEDLFAVRLRFLDAVNPRHRGAARVQHGPDRPPGDLECTGDLADPVALGL
jgi:hypothetical protein